MISLSPSIRLSLGLVAITCSLLVVLDLFGLIPAPADELVDSRVRLCEELLAQATPAAAKNDISPIQSVLMATVRRNDDLLSAGLRAPTGRLLIDVGKHRTQWKPQWPAGSTRTHMRVPLFKNGKPWATIEVRFVDAGPNGMIAELAQRPLLQVVAVIATSGFFLYLVYMRKALRHLDPTAVIPTRVQAALDVMTEGVLLLDKNEQIVLANAPFASHLGRTTTSLLGVKPSSFRWKFPGSAPAAHEFPWVTAIRESRSVGGVPLLLEATPGEMRVFVVNGSPVLDGRGRAQGAIATFDDVTELERKRGELEEALATLEKSRDEIRLQNEELEILARRDPLTGIANRRAFLELFEAQFEVARTGEQGLCCLMADIDRFKRTNDGHGHAVGDEVIRRVAETLAAEVRSLDGVCRYGGEEFCVSLPGAKIEWAKTLAERLRKKIASPGFAPVPVTVSFGISSAEFGARRPSELIKQADEALYASKRAGRDRVTRWDQRDAAEG